MKRIGVIVLGIVAACGPKPAEVSGVRVAIASEVQTCVLKGTVVGTPGVFGPLKEFGLQDARKRALELAPKLDADTVVFDPVGDVAIITEVSGSAYKCGSGV